MLLACRRLHACVARVQASDHGLAWGSEAQRQASYASTWPQQAPHNLPGPGEDIVDPKAAKANEVRAGCCGACARA